MALHCSNQFDSLLFAEFKALFVVIVDNVLDNGVGGFKFRHTLDGEEVIKVDETIWAYRDT